MADKKLRNGDLLPARKSTKVNPGIERLLNGPTDAEV